jgi:hypothetical protein
MSEQADVIEPADAVAPPPGTPVELPAGQPAAEQEPLNLAPALAAQAQRPAVPEQRSAVPGPQPAGPTPPPAVPEAEHPLRWNSQDWKLAVVTFAATLGANLITAVVAALAILAYHAWTLPPLPPRAARLFPRQVAALRHLESERVQYTITLIVVLIVLTPAAAIVVRLIRRRRRGRAIRILAISLIGIAGIGTLILLFYVLLLLGKLHTV